MINDMLVNVGKKLKVKANVESVIIYIIKIVTFTLAFDLNIRKVPSMNPTMNTNKSVLPPFLPSLDSQTLPGWDFHFLYSFFVV